MAGIQRPGTDADFDGYARFEDEEGAPGPARRLARYGVPVAIAGVAAATIGLGTALASTGGGPSLPHLTARQLLTKVASSKVQTVSGSVRINADLGLPSALTGALGSGSLAPGGSGGHAKGGSGAADPSTRLTELLAGSHTLRVAADGPDRQRLSLVDSASEYSVIRDGGQLWAYDSADNSVYHANRPDPGRAAKDGARHPDTRPEQLPGTPAQAAAQALEAVGPTTSVSVDGTARVAGQKAYELLIKPKQTGSTIGAVRIAVDAANGAPLGLTVSPSGGGPAILDVAYTKVDFGKPAAGEFTFKAPKGAKVTQAPASPGDRPGRAAPGPSALPGLGSLAGAPVHGVIGQGWTAVAELKAPDAGRSGAGKEDLGMLGSLGKPVSGSFGSGTVISTRLVNVLVTRDGAVYAGAVTPSALVKVADSAAK